MIIFLNKTSHMLEQFILMKSKFMMNLLKVTFGVLLTCILFVACETKNYEVVKIKTKQFPIEISQQKDETLDAFIEPYRLQIDREMDNVLAFSPDPMFKTDAKLNTPIGNMMADAVFSIANPLLQESNNSEIDLVLLNFGGIRSGINAGNITIRTAYEIMPFENELVVAKLAYQEIMELINYLVDNKLAHPIAGLSLSINKDGILISVNINGEDLDKEKVYLVATSDYLLTGGDQMSFFERNQGVIETNYKLRNLFIDYFSKMDTIQPKRDNRFIQLSD